MNAETFVRHIYKLWMNYSQSADLYQEYKEYLSALTILQNYDSNVQVYNIEEFMLKCISILKDFVDEGWSDALWRVIDCLPAVLSRADDAAAVRTDPQISQRVRAAIATLFEHMPKIAVECKQTCAPHLAEFMRTRPPALELKNGKSLQRWISDYKRAVVAQKT